MRNAVSFSFLGIIALAGGVLVRYAEEQILAPRFAQTAQVALVGSELNNSPTVSASWRSNSSTPQKAEYTLLFVGDIMLSRGVAYYTKQQGGSFRYPFLKIADTIRSADFAFANLEGPISNRGVNQGSIYSFRANPRVIEGLTFAGFDTLSLANNHIMDWGRDALADTISILRENKIMPVGAGMNYEEANAPTRFVIGDPPAGEAGLQWAIFAYTNLYPESFEAGEKSGISNFDIGVIRESISAIRERTDLIVVSLHWGEEYALHPTEAQREIAHALVDAGADLIVGHHPHVVQDVEQYMAPAFANAPARQGWIFYSLGNFIFDQSFTEATMQGLMIRVTVRNKRIERVESIPTQLNATFQAQVVVN